MYVRMHVCFTGGNSVVGKCLGLFQGKCSGNVRESVQYSAEFHDIQEYSFSVEGNVSVGTVLMCSLWALRLCARALEARHPLLAWESSLSVEHAPGSDILDRVINSFYAKRPLYRLLVNYSF